MPREISIEKVQGYFDALDTNKWLLFNAMNEQQVKKARDFEKHVLNVINDLLEDDLKSVREEDYKTAKKRTSRPSKSN